MPGDHTIDYDPAPGFTAPPTETVTLWDGAAQTLYRTCTGDASLVVSLFPYTALWRIDGGAWIVSDGGVASLSLGDHLVEYSAVDGYATPPAETVTIQSGQSTLYRSYSQTSP